MCGRWQCGRQWRSVRGCGGRRAEERMKMSACERGTRRVFDAYDDSGTRRPVLTHSQQQHPSIAPQRSPRGTVVSQCMIQAMSNRLSAKQTLAAKYTNIAFHNDHRPSIQTHLVCACASPASLSAPSLVAPLRSPRIGQTRVSCSVHRSCHLTSLQKSCLILPHTSRQ